MNDKEMMFEIEKKELEYFNEKAKNGGRDGSTEAYGLLRELRLLKRLYEKYFAE